jgi:hypothetical protein
MATVQGQPSVPTDTAELVFFSRVDAWLVLCVGLSIGLCFFLAWAHQSLFALAVGGFTGASVVLLTVPCKYTLGKRHLEIRCGLVKRVVAYADILDIGRSRSIVSAPALSLKRVRISCGRAVHLVSPSNRERFMAELRARAGALRTPHGGATDPDARS